MKVIIWIVKVIIWIVTGFISIFLGIAIGSLVGSSKLGASFILIFTFGISKALCKLWDSKCKLWDSKMEARSIARSIKKHIEKDK